MKQLREQYIYFSDGCHFIIEHKLKFIGTITECSDAMNQMSQHGRKYQ